VFVEEETEIHEKIKIVGKVKETGKDMGVG